MNFTLLAMIQMHTFKSEIKCDKSHCGRTECIDLMPIWKVKANALNKVSNENVRPFYFGINLYCIFFLSALLCDVLLTVTVTAKQCYWTVDTILYFYSKFWTFAISTVRALCCQCELSRQLHREDVMCKTKWINYQW